METTEQNLEIATIIGGSGPLEGRPIAELRPYARNSRTHTAEQVLEIAGSMREFGWTMPVLIDPSGEIVAGHGRVRAADLIYAGEDGRPPGVIRMVTGEDIPAGMIPVLVARGWTDAQKRAYVIADNRIAENAGWDAETLRLELSDLYDQGFALGTLGFDEKDLREMAIGVEALGALPDLATGARSDFREMTFLLLSHQADMVAEAIRVAGLALGPPSEANANKNQNGNALAELARAYLAER
ncbi:MAG TPA: ParB/Srx family N-terminal domain-containing protein [Casimicrobiaceae bacterium]|jgi:ParB-like chromosome segregation protein Spo0J|nr:ParB/Srx family N-terminal domain-containing protein [Casimicrobiaceae bacterium]